MTGTAPPSRDDHLRGAATASLLIILLIGAVFATRGPGPATTPDPGVEVASYRAGWSYVTNRQGDPQMAPWLRTDDGIVRACAAYADGYAQLDGYTDPAAVLAGCLDAAADTRLEPVQS